MSLDDLGRRNLTNLKSFHSKALLEAVTMLVSHTFSLDLLGKIKKKALPQALL